MQRKDVDEQMILAAAAAFHAGNGPTPEEALAHVYPPKVVLAKMQQMVRLGWLDYGVSLRTAWPAQNGRGRGEHAPRP